VGICTFNPDAIAASLLFLATAGVANAFLLFCIDALERRYLTRDSLELFGVADELPGLWRLLLLALVAVAGAPAFAGGSLLLPLLGGAVAAPAYAAAGMLENVVLGVLAAFAVGLLCLSAGAAVALRRMASPHFRGEARARSSFSASQSARLWVPAFFMLGAGILAPLAVEPVAAAIEAQLDLPAELRERLRNTPAFARALPTSSEEVAP
jgi:formate hydrogenlyase subunit 3/multisubunit Na+/H+ antiporter MnhD subunit